MVPVTRRLGLAALVWVVVATLGAAATLAGPPPTGTTGPLVQLDPTGGRASASFSADYWYVDGTGAKCIFTTADISWDGKKVATVKMATPPRNGAYCSVSYTFTAPPSTALGGHTVTVLACYVDGNRVRQCPRISRASATYTIAPTPTLKVSPGAAVAASGFTATYSTGETGSCSLSTAQFFWDGAALGTLQKIDPATCLASLKVAKAPTPNGKGAHRVTARGCVGARCLPATEAVTTYSVTVPKPTATPAPRVTPSPTPTPTPSHSALPSASASAVASASASVVPSPDPTRVARPTAVPTAAPTAQPSEAIVIVPGPTPPPTTGGDPFVPAMASYVSGPESGGIDPAVVATNLFLTLLILFLFALTAEIFNSTMDEHRDEVHGWWMRLAGGPFGVLDKLTVPGASLTRLSGSSRFGSIARVLLVLFLLGLVYSFLSPDFGLNTQTATLFISLVVGLGFLTYFSEASTSRLAASRYRANASIKLYGTAVIVSIVAVVLSRLVTFQPGLVYGFIASAVIVTPITLDRRADATLVLVPAVGLIVVSVAAWLMLGPIRTMATGGGWAPGLAETILAMIVIGGLETLFVSMIPLRFMDGATVMGWSKIAWALTFGTVTFLWWQLLLNQDHSYVDAMQQTNVQVVLATVVVFALTTGGLWSYFRFRPARPDATAEA